MRRGSLPAATLALIVWALAAACNGDDGGGTRTPDLSQALPVDEAIDALAAVDPRLGSLFSSATTGDIRALTELFNWQERTCGDPAAGGTLCLPETAAGAPVETVAYGPFEQPAERELIEGYLRRMGRDGFEPRLVLRSEHDRDIYWIYVTSDAEVAPEPPFSASDQQFAGMELTVDLASLAPVIRIEFLPDDFRPAFHVHPPSPGETILLYEPD